MEVARVLFKQSWFHTMPKFLQAEKDETQKSSKGKKVTKNKKKKASSEDSENSGSESDAEKNEFENFRVTIKNKGKKKNNPWILSINY